MIKHNKSKLDQVTCLNFLYLCLLINSSLALNKNFEIRDGGNYKIQNVATKRFLTVSEDGIVGLRTGMVSLMNETSSSAQEWTLTWEPKMDEKFQGYWIQSKYDYLNLVTTSFMPGASYTQINVWQIKYLGGKKWRIQNARNGLCLSITKNKRDAMQEKCSKKEYTAQEWVLIPILVFREEDDK